MRFSGVRVVIVGDVELLLQQCVDRGGVGGVVGVVGGGVSGGCTGCGFVGGRLGKLDAAVADTAGIRIVCR